MPQRDASVDHAVQTVVVAHHLVEVRVMRQRAAALHDEIQHRVPRGFFQRGEGIGAAHFLEQRIGVEAAAEGEGDTVLRQHVQR